MADIDINVLTKQVDDLNKRVQALGGTFFADISQAITAFGGGVDGARKVIDSLRKELTGLDTDVNYFYTTLKNITKELRGQTTYNRDISNTYSKLASIASKLKFDQDGITELSKKELSILKSKVETHRTDLESYLEKNLDVEKNALNTVIKYEDILDKLEDKKRRLGDLSEADIKYQDNINKKLGTANSFYDKVKNVNEEVKDLLTDQETGIQKLTETISTRLEKEKLIQKNLGLTGEAFKAMSGTLTKLGLDSVVLDDINRKLRQDAEVGKVSFKDMFKIVKTGFKESMEDPIKRFSLALAGIGIGFELIKSGINDIKKLWEVWKEFDSTIVTTARSLGMSRNQMKGLLTDAVTNQGQFNDGFNKSVYSAAQFAKSIEDINTQLGLQVDIGAADTNEFTKMTQTMGLAADEAANIYRLTKLNGLSLVDTNKSIAKGIIEVQKATGIQVNAKQVYQEIGKLSAGITAKFAQNPELIAKAVAQAKALGTNLEQVDKIGDSLLNWESSIESQLKAELITGKQLNLEKARYAALTGDQLTLTQEVAKQVGTLNEFQNMNVIAQKSLAEAFGMSRDELADMLKKQEVFAKLGDISGKSAKEQLMIARQRGLSESDSLLVNLKQQSAAETLAATFDNIKVLLADLLDGPFSGLVDMMKSLAQHASIVKVVIGALAGLSLAKLIGGLITMAVTLGEAAVAAGITNSALTFGLGAIAIAAAVGGLVALFSSSSDAVKSNIEGTSYFAEGGVVTKPITNAVVGEAGPEAIIPLGSPKADKMLGNNIDLSPMINAINDVRNSVDRLLNKEGIVYLDGENVGKVMGTVKILGTSQVQNTYKVA